MHEPSLEANEDVATSRLLGRPLHPRRSVSLLALHRIQFRLRCLSDKMAVAFFLDLLMATFFFGYVFARKPLGPVRWPWFIALSLLGTLAFSIPLFVWLNWRSAPAPRPNVGTWLRAV